MKLTYQPLANDDILRVSCQGLLSVRGLPKGSEPLIELLGPRCYRQNVILNLERSDGVDTSGIMWLVRVAGLFQPQGGRLVVYGFSPLFRNMLEVLGLTSMVPLALTEQLALELVTHPQDAGTNGTPARPMPRAFTGEQASDAS